MVILVSTRILCEGKSPVFVILRGKIMQKDVEKQLNYKPPSKLCLIPDIYTRNPPPPSACSVVNWRCCAQHCSGLFTGIERVRLPAGMIPSCLIEMLTPLSLFPARHLAMFRLSLPIEYHPTGIGPVKIRGCLILSYPGGIERHFP